MMIDKSSKDKGDRPGPTGNIDGRKRPIREVNCQGCRGKIKSTERI